MTKKDYVAISSLLNEQLETNKRLSRVADAVADLAERFADHFEKDNPNFDRERFLTAAIPKWMEFYR